jgi:hypothetical protein
MYLYSTTLFLGKLLNHERDGITNFNYHDKYDVGE